MLKEDSYLLKALEMSGVEPTVKTLTISTFSFRQS